MLPLDFELELIITDQGHGNGQFLVAFWMKT